MFEDGADINLSTVDLISFGDRRKWPFSSTDVSGTVITVVETLHREPTPRYGVTKFVATRVRDRLIDRYLRRQGWKVCRVWECRLASQPARCVAANQGPSRRIKLRPCKRIWTARYTPKQIDDVVAVSFPDRSTAESRLLRSKERSCESRSSVRPSRRQRRDHDGTRSPRSRSVHRRCFRPADIRFRTRDTMGENDQLGIDKSLFWNTLPCLRRRPRSAASRPCRPSPPPHACRRQSSPSSGPSRWPACRDDPSSACSHFENARRQRHATTSQRTDIPALFSRPPRRSRRDLLRQLSEALLQKPDSIPNALPPDRLGDGQKRLRLPI